MIGTYPPAEADQRVCAIGTPTPAPAGPGTT
jgi:hypothetical protein